MLLQEIHNVKDIDEENKDRQVNCTDFKNNNGHIKLTKCSQLRLQTKLIVIKYYHFLSKVTNSDALV